MAITTGIFAGDRAGLPASFIAQLRESPQSLFIRGQDAFNIHQLPPARNSSPINTKGVEFKEKNGNWGHTRGAISVCPWFQKNDNGELTKIKPKTLIDLINHTETIAHLIELGIIDQNITEHENIEGENHYRLKKLNESQSNVLAKKIYTSLLNGYERGEPAIDFGIVFKAHPLDTRDDNNTITTLCIGDREVTENKESLNSILSRMGPGKDFELLEWNEDDEYITFRDASDTVPGSHNIRSTVYKISLKNVSECEDSIPEEIRDRDDSHLSFVGIGAINEHLLNKNEKDKYKKIKEIAEKYSGFLDKQVAYEYKPPHSDSFIPSYVFAKNGNQISGDWDFLSVGAPTVSGNKEQYNTYLEGGAKKLTQAAEREFNDQKNNNPQYELEVNIDELAKKYPHITNQIKKRTGSKSLIPINELEFSELVALYPDFLKDYGIGCGASFCHQLVQNFISDHIDNAIIKQYIRHGTDDASPLDRSKYERIFCLVKDQKNPQNKLELFAEDESDLRDIYLKHIDYSKEHFDLHRDCAISIWISVLDEKIKNGQKLHENHNVELKFKQDIQEYFKKNNIESLIDKQEAALKTFNRENGFKILEYESNYIGLHTDDSDLNNFNLQVLIIQAVEKAKESFNIAFDPYDINPEKMEKLFENIEINRGSDNEKSKNFILEHIKKIDYLRLMEKRDKIIKTHNLKQTRDGRLSLDISKMGNIILTQLVKPPNNIFQKALSVIAPNFYFKRNNILSDSLKQSILEDPIIAFQHKKIFDLFNKDQKQTMINGLLKSNNLINYEISKIEKSILETTKKLSPTNLDAMKNRLNEVKEEQKQNKSITEDIIEKSNKTLIVEEVDENEFREKSQKGKRKDSRQAETKRIKDLPAINPGQRTRNNNQTSNGSVNSIPSLIDKNTETPGPIDKEPSNAPHPTAPKPRRAWE